jgi:hypothetical protein
MSRHLTIDYIVYEQFSPVLTADVSGSAGTICLISATDADDADQGLTVRFPGQGGMSMCDCDDFVRTIQEAARRVREYAGWTEQDKREGGIEKE